MGRVLLAQKQLEQARERFQDVITRFAKEDAATEAKKQLAALPAP
jgi:TolA-binding protein